MNKPNFVIFMADQLRFDYLGCNGHKIIKTPNIDQIASEVLISLNSMLQVQFVCQTVLH